MERFERKNDGWRGWRNAETPIAQTSIFSTQQHQTGVIQTTEQQNIQLWQFGFDMAALFKTLAIAYVTVMIAKMHVRQQENSEKIDRIVTNAETAANGSAAEKTSEESE